MTTIAYRNGVMAADTRRKWWRTVAYGFDKLLMHDGMLYGFAGSAPAIQAYRRWVLSGKVGAEPVPKVTSDGGNFVVLRAEPDGALCQLTEEGWESLSPCTYAAVGADADVAMGAMWMGGTAEDAVSAAIAHGIHTGGEVRSIACHEVEMVPT